MPRLYREAPLASIWEGSGNVMSLDVLRALHATPRALEVFLAEVEQASGADARLDARVAEPEATLRATRRRSRRARGASSKTWRSACRARCSCATRRRRSPTRSAPRASARTAASSTARCPAGSDFDAIIARHACPDVDAAERAGARGSRRPTIEYGMAPRTNFQLARIFGIRIGVGVSWFLVLFLFIFIFTPVLPRSARRLAHDRLPRRRRAVLSFFVSLILHELGHALVARRNGLQVAGIDLWALGGITRIERGADARASSSGSPPPGPLVTLARDRRLRRSPAASRRQRPLLRRGARQRRRAHDAGARLAELARDDQRARARLQPDPGLPARRQADRAGDHLVAHGRPQPRDARVTGRAGQGFALLLGLLGLWRAGHAATTRSGSARCCSPSSSTRRPARRSLQGASASASRLTVADIMDREPVTIPATATLLDAQEQFFLRYRWPWFAVVDPTRHFLGVVRAQRLDAEIAAGRPALPVTDVLEEDDCRCGSTRTSRSNRCSAPKALGRWGRWSRSTATACCRASSRSRRSARRCALRPEPARLERARVIESPAQRPLPHASPREPCQHTTY